MHFCLAEFKCPDDKLELSSRSVYMLVQELFGHIAQSSLSDEGCSVVMELELLTMFCFQGQE